MTTNPPAEQERRLREIVGVAAEAWEYARELWKSPDLDLVILVINLEPAKQIVRVVDRVKLLAECANEAAMAELKGLDFSVSLFAERTAKMAMMTAVTDVHTHPPRDFVWVIILEPGKPTIYTTIMPPMGPPICNARGGQA